MKPMHLVLAFIVLLGAAWGFLPPFTVTLLSYIGLYALVAVGLVMLTGVGGMTSFGQAAFVGLGAYATAWISLSPEAAQWLGALPKGAYPWVGLLLGLVVTAAVACPAAKLTLPLEKTPPTKSLADAAAMPVAVAPATPHFTVEAPPMAPDRVSTKTRSPYPASPSAWALSPTAVTAITGAASSFLMLAVTALPVVPKVAPFGFNSLNTKDSSAS